MNIFILDNDFQQNAIYHVDSHIVKMPTEASQMLATCLRFKHGTLLNDVYLLDPKGNLKQIKNFYFMEAYDELKIIKSKRVLIKWHIPLVSHLHHPCTLWVNESKSNWLWLRKYALALNREWQYRYNHTRNHLSINKIIQMIVPDIEDKGLTPFVQAMPEQYQDINPVIAYRRYYRETKGHLISYKKRSIPTWLEGTST